MTLDDWSALGLDPADYCPTPDEWDRLDAYYADLDDLDERYARGQYDDDIDLDDMPITNHHPAIAA